MEPPRRKKAESGEGTRKRRKTAVYDADGNEVLISLMCLKCRTVKPLAQFGLRKMSDGAIRNQPWCRGCRGAVTKKEPASARKETAAQEPTVTPVEVPAVAAPLVAAETVAPAAAETLALPAASVADPAPALIAAEPPARLEVEDSPEQPPIYAPTLPVGAVS
jgi:hypothetical protein